MADEELELLDPYARLPIYEKKVLGSIKDALTYEGPKVKVTVDNIYLDSTRATKQTEDIQKLKELKLNDGTLSSDIRADLTIKTMDGTKKVKDVHIGSLPSLTPHRSFLVGGTEYITPIQARLRPGVYTRVQENGIVESHFNFAKTSLTRIPFRIELEPESGVFKVSVSQGTVPLYPLLISVGVKDSDMAKAWGGDILTANQKQKMTSSAAVIKFMEIVTGEKGKLTEREAIDGFMAYLSGARLDADVTQITLGKSFDTVTIESILAATKKILSVNRGDEKPDDRDAIVFKSVHTFDDFVDEAVQKAKRVIQVKMNRNIQKYGPVAGAIPKDDIVRAIMHPFIGGAGLASYVEQYNPYQVVGETQSISVMGEGGLGSINAATMEARAVHPSSIGVIDPIGTPQSEKVGLKQKIALGAMRRGDSLVTKVLNLKTNKVEYKSPPELYGKYVALSDQYDWAKKKFEPGNIRGTYKGDLGIYPKDKIEFVYVEQQKMFSYHTLSVPFMSANQGNRMLMSDNMLDQIIPVVNADVPLVMPHGGVVSSAIAQTFDRRAIADGVVTKVSDGSIHIKSKDKTHTYPVYKSYPLNNAYLDSTPLVAVGDKVKAGQVLTESDFTTSGHVALGKNLLTAFMPYKGFNHEDAIVISETASKKMSSKHMYKYSSKTDENSVIDRGKFASTFPSVITKENLGKLTPEGIVAKGAKVSPGEIVIAHMTKRNVSEDIAALGRVHKAFMRPWKATPVIYDGQHGGTVVDSVITGGTYKVYIESVGETEVGDKFVNYHAAKGIIGSIIPDSEMPHTLDGRPVEVLLNTAGIIGRINPGQVLEMAAGKVAEKTGKTFYSKDFNKDQTHLEHVMGEMKKHGIEDKEELVDPVTGKSFGKIAIGPMHIFKLKHRATDKLSTRSRGGYDVDMKPSRGGDDGSKRIDTMLYHALLAHGAVNNLQEATSWKGDRSDSFWNALQTGSPLPAPAVPFVFEKMVGLMKGAGINVDKTGDDLKLSPMTDHQILAMSKGVISEPTAVRAKNFTEIKGGLFDRKATGGISGKEFSHIALSEPIMNPVFTKTVSKLLGMTSTKIDSIAASQSYIDINGKPYTGGEAIKRLLKGIDIDKTLVSTKESIKKFKGTKLNDANYVIHILENLKDLGEKPEDAFVLHNIPVIPPMFRPVYPTSTGQLRVSPLNFHYQDIMLYNKALQEGKKLPDEMKQDARRDLYRSVKATMGLAAPLQTTIYRAQTDNLPGLLEIIRGDDGAKGGFFQDKVWAKSQDLSARSVIAPGPRLGLDEASIPEEMAWKLYRPFIVREMGRLGKKTLDAMKEIDSKSPLARGALTKVMDEHPIILNRAPTLHKYGVLAFKPKISKESVMRVPPFVLHGYGGDFDGDSVISQVLTLVNLTTLDLSCYTNNVDEWISSREVKMPSCARVFMEDDERALIVDMSEFPRINGSATVTENGTIIYKVPAGISILTRDVNGWRRLEVKEFSIHPSLDNCTVEYFTGESFIVSDDHSLIVWGGDGLVKCRPEDSIGKISPRKARIEPERKEVSIHVDELGTYPLDMESGRFLGMMVGDGWVSPDSRNGGEAVRQICFANVEECLRGEFAGSVSLAIGEDRAGYTITTERNLFNMDRYGTGSKISIGSIKLGPVVRRWIGHMAVNKHLPPFWVGACEEFRIGLLSGLIDTDGVCGWVKAKAKKKRQIQVMYHTISPELAQQVVELCRTLGVRARATGYKSTSKGTQAWAINISSVDLRAIPLCLRNPGKAARWAEFLSEPVSENTMNLASTRIDIIPFSEELGKIATKTITCTEDILLYGHVNKYKRLGYIPRITARRIAEKAPDMPSWWIDLINDEETQWARVERVTKNDLKATMYDISVDAPYTFMLANGIVVQDTMQAYVPVSNKAVAEARGMFPSKHGVHPATGEPIMIPRKDILYGLYDMSRTIGSSTKKFRNLSDASNAVRTGKVKVNETVTIGTKRMTPGQAMLSSIIPGDLYKHGDLITSKKIAEIAKKLSRGDSELYGKVMNQLKDFGDENSSGFTIGISDLQIGDSKRTAMLKKYKKEIEESTLAHIGPTIGRAINALEDHSMKQIEKKDSPLYHSVISGAGGGPGDIRQLITSPVTVGDHRDRPIRTVFQRSYGEGLGLSDYWMASYGARKGVVGRSLMTYEPGTVMKRTMSTMAEMSISLDDCGTKRGIDVDTADGDALDRCLAEAVGGFSRNDTVTSKMISILEKKNIKKIKVRSPLTCEAVHGICAKCFGVDHNGNFPRVGANVGTEYGQYLTEPLFSSSMKSFHTGSAVSTRAEENMSGFHAVRQLLEMKNSIRGKAAIASRGGKVNSIEVAPAGGHYIEVGGLRHYSLPGYEVVVKKGETVVPGQRLSLGALKPQEFLEATHDPMATQQAIVGEMKRVYNAGGYKKLHGKTFELFARTVGNFGTVKDPGDSNYTIGDTVKLSEVNSLNKDFSHPMKVDPQVYGIEKAPSMSRNWLARLGFTRLKGVFEEMAAIGSKSNVKSGIHPLPKYVYGKHFGEIEKP